jgi:diguanylate cyclase (GGDEF)-like protein
MLHFILRPLKRIKHQAEGILNNEFIIEKQEPYTTEFKEVSRAMNSMVRRVQEIYQQATEALKRNKELQYNDAVTKLFNRRYLMLKLPELIALEGKTEGGSIMLLAIEDAEHINQILGRQRTDTLFYEFAQLLRDATLADDESLATRVNGTEFILVLPNTHIEGAEHIAHNILQKFATLLEKYHIPQTQSNLSIGIYRYKADITIADLLSRVDTALLHAKNSEDSSVYIYDDTHEEISMSKTEWRGLLEKSIQKENFLLHFTPVRDTKTKTLMHKLVSFELLGEDGNHYDYNAVIAPAITLGLASELYLHLLKLLFSQHRKQLRHINYAIKLPKEFLEDESNFDKLAALFDKEKKSITEHLCFEVSDSFAAQKTATLLGYVDLFRKYGLSLGIHSYTANANDFSYLKELSPKYIKTDAHFLLDQSQDAISSLQLIVKSLDIIIIATGVDTEDDVEMLRKYNIYKLQGTVVDKI